MLLTEVVEIGEEGGANGFRNGEVIRSRMRINCVSLADERLGKELAEVSEPQDSNFQLGGLIEAADQLGFVVVGLRGVDCTDAKAMAAEVGMLVVVLKRRGAG